MADLTPAACRAARALARWSMDDLSREAGVSLPTVQRVEGGKPVYASTIAKLIEAFTVQGIEVYAPPLDGARRIPTQ